MGDKMKVWPLLLTSVITLSAQVAADNKLDYGDYSDLEEYSDEEDEFEGFYGDDDFVSIATGTRKIIYKAPAVATVITGAQLEQMGALTVAEALQSVPGLHIYPSPFNRLNTSFSFRGMHTDQNPQVLFLVNGLPIREEYTGARPQTLKIPIHNVSRVEVIRGPGSAVYGADAFSGVINVITKTFDELKDTYAGVRYGSFDSHDVWLQSSAELEDWKLSFSFERLKGDGDKDRILERDLQSIFDDLFGTNASRAPGPFNTQYDVTDIRLNAEKGNFSGSYWFWRNQDAGQGAGAANALDPFGLQRTSIHQLDLHYKMELEHWQIDNRYSYYSMSDKAIFNVLPAGTLVPLGADGNLDLSPNRVGVALFTDGFKGNPQPAEKLHAFDFTGIYEEIANHRIRVGVGASKRTLRANEEKNFGPSIISADDFTPGEILVVDGTLTDLSNSQFKFVKDSDRTIYYVSLQDEWNMAPDWELTAGIRYDHYSDFGSTINPRAALVWQTSRKLTTKFLYGRAFRAPAFDTLYAQNNPVGLGNPALDPETIDTYEVSFTYQLTPDSNLSVNAFYYSASELISWVPDEGTTTSTAQNAGEQKADGIEAEYHYKGDAFDLHVNYSYHSAEDKKTNADIAQAPQQLFYINALWTISDQFSLDAKSAWVGSRKRAPGDERPELSDYATVDLALNWRVWLGDNWNVKLIGKNIFDKKAYEPSHPLVPHVLGPMSDLPIEGRSVALQVSNKF